MEKKLSAFEKRVVLTLESIDATTLAFDPIEAAKYADLYAAIESYAFEKELYNTAVALPIVRGLLMGVSRSRLDYDKDGNLQLTYYEHCLAATKMLIDLHIPLEKDEKDILFAATLCHDFIENIPFSEQGMEMITKFHLDQRVYDIVKLITRPRPFYEIQKKEFYGGIEKDKLAILVALADRSNLMESVYGLSISNALEYVREIRNYALPMCVHAKEEYTDIHMVINILMEKIRCLIDVTDIISSRYQKREVALSTEILSLMEENARIRGLIRRLEKERGKV